MCNVLGALGIEFYDYLRPFTEQKYLEERNETAQGKTIKSTIQSFSSLFRLSEIGAPAHFPSF